MKAVTVFAVVVLTKLVLLNSAEKEPHLRPCPPFHCLKLGNVGNPFYDNELKYCIGLFPVDRTEPYNPKVRLKKGGHWYELTDISQADSISINGTDLQRYLESSSCEALESFGLPSPSKIVNVTSENTLSLFKCSHSFHNITSPVGFHHRSCGDYNIYYHTNTTNHVVDGGSFRSFPQQYCSFIRLPAASKRSANLQDFFSFLTADILLRLHVNFGCSSCFNEPDRCFFDSNLHTYNCVVKEKRAEKVVHKATIASTCAGLVLILVFLYCLVRKLSPFQSIYLWKKPNQAHQKVEAFLKEYDIPTKRYSYLDVKRMTNSFKNKIGQGGYGCVYQGNLPNGHLVAVKVLNQLKGNGEEFINEVATISRTSHVNIVSLLGFCFESSKRALIYEFMHNGSLEKFIFEQNQNQIENHSYLEWGTLYQISLGIARGLEYLHRGCNTRILHFDIKPHNILLDRDFTPKISDFGLAKVCMREESIISTLDARGTIGYIAPEVFSRNFGGVSHKSDVYSYGMMVMEMVGGRKNVNVRAECTSVIYFPHWIYKRVELNEELRLKRITTEDEKTKVRKMIMASLWCIQTDPKNRPTMSRVIEILEGSLGSIEVPPKPYLSSPSRSFTESSSGHLSLQYNFLIE